MTSLIEPSNPVGITVDSDHVWIIDNYYDVVFKYYTNLTYTGETFSISENSVDITHNDTYFWVLDQNFSVEPPGDIYMYLKNSSYPENVTIDTGLDGGNDYTNTTVFNTSEIVDLNITAINNYLHDTCTADWATGYCDVPFNVSSVAVGILEISDINVTGEYIPPVGNSSLFYYTPAINFSFVDESTGDPMTGNASWSFTVFWGGFNYTYNGSVNNTAYFDFGVFNDSEFTADMFMEFSADGYPTRYYFMDDVAIDDVLDDIYLYLLDDATADPITFTIRDSYQNLVSSVIIYAQKYYPESDDYKTVGMGKTGPEGNCIIQLESDKWYKYIVIQDGSIALNTDPQQLIDTSVELFLGVIGELSFFNYYGNVATNCYYNETTMIFICTYADTSGKLQHMNLTITERFLNNSAWVVVCYDESVSVSGTLTCDLTGYYNRTLYYELVGRHCCTETTWFPWASGIIDEIAGELIGNLGLTTVLMSAILLLSVAAVGFYNPRLAIVYGLVVFIIISPVMNILPVNWTISGGIIVVGVFLIYLMGDHRVKVE